MTAVVGAITPIFLLIVAGYALKQRGFPGAEFWAPAERLSYFVFLPSLIIHTLASADLAGIRIGGLAVTVFSMAMATTVLAVLVRPILQTDGPAFTSIFQGSIRLNSYIGFAFALAFYGSSGLAIAAVFVALMMPIVNIICVAVLVAYGASGRISWSRVTIGIATNPLILGCLAGAALNSVAGEVPGWVTGVLGILAQAALPLALLCVGAGLDFSSLRTQRCIILATSTYKLVVFPVLAWGIVSLVGLTGVSLAVVMLFAATPASPSTYVMARQLGGDADLMAGIVTAQTALSVFSISVVLVLIGNIATG